MNQQGGRRLASLAEGRLALQRVGELEARVAELERQLIDEQKRSEKWRGMYEDTAIVAKMHLEQLEQYVQDSGLDHTTGLAAPSIYSRARPAAEADPNVAFIFCDLDDFGRLNKIHDHDYGDDVLAQKGRLIKEAANIYGVSARRCFRRRHGDELIVLCPVGVATDLAKTIVEADAKNEAPLSCGAGSTEKEAEKAMKTCKAAKKAAKS